MAVAGKVTTVTNTSSNRVIIGAPPRSKTGGKRMKGVILDTPADDSVPQAMRIGRTHPIDSQRAAFLKRPNIAALAEKLGLRVSGG